jgi:hypothetical protein
MVEVRERHRRTLSLAPSEQRPRGGRGAPDKRIKELLSRSKAAEGQALYSHAQLRAALAALMQWPEAAQAARLAAFQAGLQALSAADPNIAKALEHNAPDLCQAAAERLLLDVNVGPRVAAALACDAEQAARIARMTPEQQCMSIGELIAAVSTRKQPGTSTPPSVHSLFGLAGAP